MKKIISSLSFGLIFQWLALFLSYKTTANTVPDLGTPMAVGGFPFKSFEYPFPVLGGGLPPIQTWVGFLLNLGVWTIVGLIISLLLGKRVENKKIFVSILSLAIIMSTAGFIYLVLKFD